jgi:hypothetical protein
LVFPTGAFFFSLPLLLLGLVAFVLFSFKATGEAGGEAVF